MPFPPEHINLNPCPIHRVEPTMTEQQLRAMDEAGELIDPPLFRSEPRVRAVGWQPIETGPTNVLVVALFRGKRPVIAHKNSERDNPRGWCHAEALGSFDEPNRGLTHYMPLPPAPTSQEKDHA